MFGILILFSLVNISHSAYGYNVNIIAALRNMLLLLLTYYAFLQLNFSLISHNFGIRQGDVADFRIIYLLTVLVILSSF